MTFHSRHHRLYVPYAYGALYNHPLEGFALDTLGGGLGYLLTGMTMRQSMWFFTGSTIKTVLDHSGYEFPWSLHHFLPFWAGAEHHDVHHEKFIGNYASSFRWWDFCLDTEAGAEASKARREKKLAKAKAQARKAQ